MQKNLQVRAALALAVLALVLALGGVAGAVAGPMITGAQIKDNSLTTRDYRKGSVRTADVQNGGLRSPDLATEAVQSVDLAADSVQAADIGGNQVTPEAVAAPEPQQIVQPGTFSTEVAEEFAPIDQVATYTKVDATSILEISWTGSASAGFVPCQFQVRVDGAAAAPGAGVFYVANGSVNGNVMLAADFDLPAGPHEISIAARSLGGGGASTCTVGPAEAQIAQTFVVGEKIV